MGKEIEWESQEKAPEKEDKNKVKKWGNDDWQHVRTTKTGENRDKQEVKKKKGGGGGRTDE